MILDKDTQSRLRGMFGLNLYEVNIWTSLLSQGSATAGQLAEMSEVPRSRTYDILQSLEKRGFIVMQVGKPIKYTAVPPGEVVDRVKKSVVEEAERSAKRLEKAKTDPAMQKLGELFSTGIKKVETTGMTSTIKGRGNMYKHLAMLIKGAKKTVIVSTSDEGIVRKASAMHSIFKQASKKGVSIKVATPSGAATSGIEGIAEVFSASGLSRFAVIDSEQAILMVSDDSDVHPNYDSAIWINSPYVSRSLEAMFNTHAKKA